MVEALLFVDGPQLFRSWGRFGSNCGAGINEDESALYIYIKMAPFIYLYGAYIGCLFLCVYFGSKTQKNFSMYMLCAFRKFHGAKKKRPKMAFKIKRIRAMYNIFVLGPEK